ncbi:type 3 dihydrofolate reductase [Idiomarina tyrosinivorans]|uniref:Dihydrofolate reductase n=1 Tax=Idiomarina tyrosinivorans TaxID=1445662 RepID=A0A432ZRA4_9GAMM|nr:type 3 dihydrofolate reductase [Idiomarina tyrosinivorans]RUO80361.1 type 3 dihydrofolate reductase [Idiomarina tyrosinivorans]
MTTVSLIAAMAADRVIGKDNDMPWHLPNELQYFKSITMAKPIIMGRNTFESIGRPLPGRKNIVVSRSQPSHDGVIWVSGVEQALTAAGPVDEVMIIGGGKLYEAFIERADKLYITDIELTVAGDTFFPDYQALAEWDEIESHYHAAKDVNDLSFTTRVLRRKR